MYQLPPPRLLSGRPLLVLVGLLGGTFGACTKKPEAPAPTVPPPDATTALLAAHPWHIVAFTVTEKYAQPVKTYDYYAMMGPGRRDDTYQFKADQRLVFDEGPLRESPADPQQAAGSWTFENGQTGLTITLRKTVPLGTTGVSSSSTYTVQELNATTLRLTSDSHAQAVFYELSR